MSKMRTSISDILAWQVDFFDVKEGDSFRVMYDVVCIDDTTELKISSVEGLIFVHQEKAFTAIPFSQDSIRDYFDAQGNGLRKAFLKAPLDFSRITSRFTNARFHPIPEKASSYLFRHLCLYLQKNKETDISGPINRSAD